MAILEVCCGDMGSVIAAIEGGAQRVELCAALSEGGVTPSAALISAAVATGITVHVLIRPRNGDFLYSPQEISIMEDDIRRAVDCGAGGIVTGALRADGHIDMEASRRLIRAAGDVPVTFHRAFDLCRDPAAGLEDAAALGCRRILTSGGAATAAGGADALRRLNDLARGRITILAGGGVTPANAAGIVRATGVTELHASARTPRHSQMQWRSDGVSMGTPGTDEYTTMVTSPAIVAEIIRQIHNL